MGLMQQIFYGIPTTAGAPTPPTPTTDALFNYVNLLLSGNTTTGNPTFLSDASSSNLLITSTGTVRNDNFSPFAGNGYYSTYFTGATDYLSLPSSAFAFGTGDFTFEFWYFVSSFANTGDHLDLAFDNGTWQTGVSGTQLNFEKYGSGWGYFILPNAVFTNQWTHIAITRQSGTLRGFVNGVQVASATGKTDNLSGGIGTINRRAGQNGADPQYISNVRAVIGTAVYTGNFSVPTSPLTAIAGTSVLTCQSTRFVDNSANSLAVTVTGTPKVSYNQPIYSAGQIKSIKFNGSTDYLSLPFSSALAVNSSAPFTVETWVYLTSSANGDVFCMRDGAGNVAGWEWAIVSQNSSFGWDGSGRTALSGTSTISLNTWTHLAVSYDGTTLRYFKNGVLDSSVSSIVTSTPTSATPYIGVAKYSGTTTRYFPGYMSNLRIVNGTALYTANFTPSTTPLTAITNTSLLTLQGSIADASSNAFVLAVAGSTTTSYSSPFAYTANPLPTAYGSGYFAGTGTDYITTASITLGTSPYTIEWWYYPTAINSGTQFFVSPTSMLLAFNGTSYWGRTNQGSWAGATTTTSFPNIGQWNHMAVVREGTGTNQEKIYLNGVLVATGTNSTNYAATTFDIAKTLAGYVSNFRVATTAVYTGNFTPSTTPLTAITNTSLLTLQNTVPSKNSGMLDTSAIDASITSTGTPTQGTFSPFSQSGWSGYFNGTSAGTFAIGSTPAVASNGDFTVELWASISAQAGLYSYIASSTQSPSQGWAILVKSTGALWVQVGLTNADPATNGLATSAVLALNTWYHIAMVRSSGSVKVYVNGNLVATSVVANTATIASSLTYVGGPSTAPQNANYTHNGYISNIRFVTSAVYTNTFTPPTSPLTAIAGTTLLALQNNRFKDNSTNNYAFLQVSTSTSNIQPVSPFEPTESYSVATNGGSTYFNGSTDHITVPTSGAYAFGTNDFTIELWAYPTALANNAATLIGMRPSGANGAYPWLYLATATTLTYYVNTTAAITGPVLMANTWYHIAVVRINGQTKMYVNGVQVGVTYTDSTNYLIGASGVTIGYDAAGTANYRYAGYMSGIRLVNGIGLYGGAFTPPAVPATLIPNTSLLISGTNNGVIDAAGKNNLVTVGSAATQLATSKFPPSSMYFDGSTGYAYAAGTSPQYAFGSGNFTIEAWAYRTSTGLKGFIDMRPAGNTVSATPAIYINANNQFCYYVSGADRIITTTQTTTGTWYHIALVRNGTSTKMYINGVQEGSTFPDTNVYITEPNRPIIGCDGGPTNYFAGYIDDLRITRGVARYTGNFTPPAQSFPTK